MAAPWAFKLKATSSLPRGIAGSVLIQESLINLEISWVAAVLQT